MRGLCEMGDSQTKAIQGLNRVRGIPRKTKFMGFTAFPLSLVFFRKLPVSLIGAYLMCKYMCIMYIFNVQLFLLQCDGNSQTKL